MYDTRDKEVIKNIQAKAEIINKVQDKASKVLVLSLGSYTIKMGFANEKVPFTIRPFVAYRKKQSSKIQEERETEIQDTDIQVFKREYSEIQTYLKTEGIISSQHKPVKGKPRGKQNIPIGSYPQFSGRDILYSQQALTVQDCPEQYTFRKPLQHGQLNIKSNSAEEVQLAINDIERLLKYMLKEKMKIPQKQWKTFSCIIAVPDVFIRQHTKQLLYTIFAKIGFNRIYIHLQSVLACLGTSISSAVVVDVGHEKINVCCVEQGVILPKTLVRKNFGMKHVTKTMIKLFNNKINEQGFDLSVNSQADQGQVDKIKQVSCSVKQPEQNSNKVFTLKTFREKKQVQIQINYSDVMCIAANSAFFNIWNAFPFNLKYLQAFNSYSQLYDLQPDPQDLFEEYSGGGHIYEIQQDNVNYPKQIADPYIYQSLEQLVSASISSIKDAEVRKKFLSNVLIIGGGGLLPQLSEQLIFRLNKIYESSETQQKAESATDLLSKDIDCSHSSWLGGTVLPKLDSLRDLWIQRSKYMGTMKEQYADMEEQGILDKKLFTRKEQSQQWGIRYLKEKIPFLW